MSKTVSQQNVQYALYVGGFILIAGLGYWLYKTVKKKNQSFAPTSSAKAPVSTGFSCRSTSYPLEYGTCHADVKKLQNYLKKKGHSLGSSGPKKDGVDGQFGRLTQKAAQTQFGKVRFNSSEILKLS